VRSARRPTWEHPRRRRSARAPDAAGGDPVVDDAPAPARSAYYFHSAVSQQMSTELFLGANDTAYVLGGAVLPGLGLDAGRGDVAFRGGPAPPHIPTTNLTARHTASTLARVNVTQLFAGDFSGVEYWATLGGQPDVPRWLSHAAGGDAGGFGGGGFGAPGEIAPAPVFKPWVRGSSLHFNEYMQQWYCIGTNGSDIVLWTSDDAPVGDWVHRIVYTVPMFECGWVFVHFFFFFFFFF
jgi:hypothetical protein